MNARLKDPFTMAQLLLHVPESSQPRQIGWLSQFGDNLRVSFAADYIEDPNRPTLSQLYTGANDGETRAILQAVNDERLVRIGKLPTFFSNLLPEGVNRERLAQQRGVTVEDELELLAAAGHDLTGGVEVVPADDVPKDVQQLHATKNLEPIEPGTVAAPIDNGFSIDGIQTKFSMVHDGRRYVIRHGTAAGDFIAKLPSPRFKDLVLNEGICMRMAKAVGVNTANAEVRPIAELGVPDHVKEAFGEFLLVDRFDRFKREDGSTGRIHFEELTQAIGLDAPKKYQDMEAAMRALLTTLKASPKASADIDEFFRRWTVNALLGNPDAHSKNWGLIYLDGRRAQLSPAYDIVSVASYFDSAKAEELSMNRKIDQTLRTWGEDTAAALAHQVDLYQVARIRRVVRETQRLAVALWPAMLEEAPERVRDTVRLRLKELVPAKVSKAPATSRRAGP
ncbi:type II toxin-antitoxin system HipA family toxin [Roseateles cellulosilyticus]|uniref:HipA domain-containing protein n=1 Tax=Pelomonas cellulosilytica TaxID=2906762 RepID=A0ABS8Y475_9BURK|nr:HipA domain-containing protein [Pelomonas sp. P8]MCE4558076.1 HipA domain-containing protein [Pelomonas sp. P8]